ncbi:MAG: NnrS family protein [Alphaproteobacteria bacterium]|nr:NnrS family protein [Alphaproteobacteria bacterium]
MIDITEPGRRADVPAIALFRYGFRPFFLGAGLWAVLSVLLWVHAWHDGGLPAAIDLGWHVHETVFGFAGAALAGFMLTAVPNWTSAGPVRGRPLAALFALWLSGRALSFTPESGWMLFAGVDLLFLPSLAAVVGPSVLRDAGRRSGILVVGLLVLTIANATWHADRLGYRAGAALPAAHAGLAVLAVMVTLIGGRIVPAFTLGGMRMAGTPVAIEPWPLLDRAVLTATGIALALWVAGFGGSGTAAALFAAAGLQAWRLGRWQGWRTRRVPLVWILHLGMTWLVVALSLLALGVLDVVPRSAGIHALGGGAAGTMILAVMTRATLGHTGRPLAASRLTVAAFALVTVAATLRVAAAVAGTSSLLPPAGLAWSAGFGVFVVAYGPMLVRARPDGRGG